MRASVAGWTGPPLAGGTTGAPVSHITNDCCVSDAQLDGAVDQSGFAESGAINYKQLVARQMLDTLDEDSVWRLARALLQRGLLHPVPLQAASVKGVQTWPSSAGVSHTALLQTPPGDVAQNAAYVPQTTPNGSMYSVPFPSSPPQVGDAASGPSPISVAQLAPSDVISHQDRQLVLSAGSTLPLSGSAPLAATSAPMTAETSTDTPEDGGIGNSDARHGNLAAEERRERCADDDKLDAELEYEKQDDHIATTLILRNLPQHFDQRFAQDWIDQQGFGGLYDFFLWFPAKQTSRLNSCGYAFVNFRSIADAQRFRRELHLMRIVGTEGDQDSSQQLPLSIAVAKVQGFAENYVRFQHLLVGATPTRCAPFFAQDSVDALSVEQLDAAASASSNNAAFHVGPPLDGNLTTVIIRNLPPAVETQDITRTWLNELGFKHQYDFLLFLPAKRSRRGCGGRNASPAAQGFGYAFVNFVNAAGAQLCVDMLNGKALHEGDPALSVVGARVQGLQACTEHFQTLAESGRCTPWVRQTTWGGGREERGAAFGSNDERVLYQ